MNPLIVLLILALYFGVLLFISKKISAGSDTDSFFNGNKNSPWYVVAIGMIGATISGVTFLSLPGTVVNSGFKLAQFILGNIVGYLFIVFVLIPLYYRLQLVSIYSYLKDRFGFYTYKTGAGIFSISQSFGAALRMLLAIKVLQTIFFDHYNIPLFVTAILFLVLIWIYTKQSGIKTLVWTDLIQTISMILAVVVTLYIILIRLDISLFDFAQIVSEHPSSVVFDWDPKSNTFFWKQFIAGILIAIAMMGLDQNMMQKSLTCKNVRDAQKNVFTFSITAGLVQLFFLVVGLGLYIYISEKGVILPENVFNDGKIVTDKVFAYLATNEFGAFAFVTFVIGVVAASFSSADSSVTALTTSFCYDFLEFETKGEKEKLVQKKYTHIAFSIVLLIIILVFSNFSGDIFSTVFQVAGYTYGPLLGLFVLGILTSVKTPDFAVPFIAIASPILSYLLVYYLKDQYNNDLGFAVIGINALLFISLCLLSNLLFLRLKIKSSK